MQAVLAQIPSRIRGRTSLAYSVLLGPAASGMTCARRLAGARKPAPSAGSPSRPDPRSGRLRARLTRLLPVLALLLGALSPFAAAPAAAEVLVSNLSQSVAAGYQMHTLSGVAQPFTTGSSSAGYVLESIEFTFHTAPLPDTVMKAELWSTGTNVPGSKLADLTLPNTIAVGAVEATAPDGTVLAASTTYWAVLYYVSGDASDTTLLPRFSATNSDNEDSGAAAGWSIGDGFVLGTTAKFTSDTGNWNTGWSAAALIRVNGIVVPPPTAVTVSASGPLREGGTVDVTFTLDQPAPARMLTTVGHDGHAWVKFGRGPVFAAGATTAVMRISVPQDAVDNNCRTLDFRVRFGWGSTSYEHVLDTAVSFSVVDDDGTADTCSGLLGSPDPTALTLPFGRLRLNRDWNSVTAWLLPTLDKPAVSATFVTVTHSVSAAADPTHFKVYDTRVLIRDGDTYPRYRNARGEWADFPVTVFVSGDADASHTITLTARTDFGLTTTYALNVGDVRRLAGQQGGVIPENPGGESDFVPPAVSLSVSPNPVDEGSPVTVTATLVGTLPADLTVPIVVTRGESEDGDHGTLSSIVIPALTTSASATIATTGDADTEDETFTVALGELPPFVTAGAVSSVEVTITDDGGSSQGTDRETEAISRYAALIAKVKGWRDDPCCAHNPAHTDRWDRVLLALGETVTNTALTPMGAAEAQTYADRGWTRWVEVAAALKQIENGGTQTPPPVQTPVPVVSIAAGAAVTEGGSATFTLTASPAPAVALAVAVTVSQSGDYAAPGATGARTVTVPTGGTATFTVATVDDGADEADGSVTAALASGTGYTVSSSLGAATATVAVTDNDEAVVLPGIVTDRTIVREAPGAAAVFTVRLDRAATGTVSVDYATANGAGRWAGTAPARAGADYTATSGTLTFAAGERSRSVRVPILDDSIDEGIEYFLLRFSNPRGATLAAGHRETQGLIRNSDPLQAMWLSRFGRMVASDAVAAVTARFETPRDAGSHLTVAGQRLDLARTGDARALADVLTGFAQAFGAPAAPAAPAAADDDPFARPGLTHGWEDPAVASPARRVTGRDLLLGTSFRAVLGRGAGSQLTSWGQGASVSRFSAAVPGLSLTGESATGSLGVDYERGRLLAGFAMTHSAGGGEARDAEWRYAMGSTVTTLLPFARLRVSERLSAWGLAGTGTGRLTLDLDGRAPQQYGTALAMTLTAMGVRGDLVTPAAAGGFALALKADAFWVRTESDAVATSAFGSLMGARGESSRVRAVLDGSRTFVLAGGATLAPSVQLGLRQDGGDAETGTGVEFGAGLGYADPARGLDLALRVHGLAAHAEDRYDEWGVSGSLRLAPGAAGRGFSASLTPSWGATPGGTERLWALPDASALAAGGDVAASSRLDAELGYGVGMLGGGFTGTPHVGFGLTDAARELRMGWRLSPAVGGGFEASFDATRREPVNDDAPEHGVMLRSLLRW